MKRIFGVSVAVVLVFIMYGCATPGGMSDETATKVQGTAAGSILGAGIGYLIDGERGAAWGAGLGAAGGYVAGNEVAKRKAEYARQEDLLDSEVRAIVKNNQAAKRYNKQLAREVRNIDRRIARLEKSYRAGQVGSAELQKEKNAIRDRIKTNKKMVTSLKREYKTNVAILKKQEKAGNQGDPKVKQLKKEITILKRNISDLQDSTIQLATINDRVVL